MEGRMFYDAVDKWEMLRLGVSGNDATREKLACSYHGLRLHLIPFRIPTYAPLHAPRRQAEKDGEWPDVMPHNAADSYHFLQHAGTEHEFHTALHNGPMNFVCH